MNRQRYVADIADDYWDAGWSPFPLPRGAKKSPPPDVTGEDARPITEDDLDGWAHKWGNIGIVMPDGVIGIDYDAYKPGNHAPTGLPPTVRSTSRTDGSGIYMFRVPKGTKLQGSVPGVGEVIQHHHRYAVCWPSIHPEGREYVWLDAGWREVGIPRVRDLPRLPKTWLEQLQTRQRKYTGRGYKGSAESWFDALQKGPMTPAVCTALRESTRELEHHLVVGEARYDLMVRGIGRLVSLGARRHRGVEKAIDELCTTYLQAVEGTPDRDPDSEVARALTGAIEKWGGRR